MVVDKISKIGIMKFIYSLIDNNLDIYIKSRLNFGFENRGFMHFTRSLGHVNF